MKKLVLVGGLFLLSFALLTGVFLQRAQAPGMDLPVLGAVPAFSLTDTDGAELGLEALRGKVWVADFIFTSCGGPCPAMTEAMAGVADAFKADDRVRFVSVTVDPDTDTPERLKEYGLKYGARLDQWHFLTGPLEAIQKLAVEGMKVGSVEDPIIHSTRFILVDKAGSIRGYYTGTIPEEVTQMQQAMRQLAEETA